MGANVFVDTKLLTLYRKSIKNATSDGLQAGGNAVHDLAQQLAPKDTKALSESGLVTMRNTTTVEISFGNNLPDSRAVAQEYGTVFMPPQPYLTPALRAINIAQYVADELKKI